MIKQKNKAGQEEQNPTHRIVSHKVKKFQLLFLRPAEQRECDQYQEVENTMIGNGNGKKRWWWRR